LESQLNRNDDEKSRYSGRKSSKNQLESVYFDDFSSDPFNYSTKSTFTSNSKIALEYKYEHNLLRLEVI
jgi:hypothetical protein